VQSQHDPDFAQRVFVSNYRLFDSQSKPVASLVILSDDRPRWRPTKYGYDVFGSRMQLRFRTVKLLDYREKMTALETDPNPFAVVTLTHLKALETRGKNDVRYDWKRRLFRSLYHRGWAGAQIRHLYDFIDWMVDLSEELNDKLWQEMRQYEEEINMPYINSAERYGMKKGLEQGRQEGRQEGELQTLRTTIEEILKLRFGALPEEVSEYVNHLNDLNQLRHLQREAVLCPQLETFTEQLSLAE
jgi:hypothetical protein